MVDLVFLESNQQRCCLQNSLFARSDVGILGKTRSSSKTKKKLAATRKSNHKNTQSNNKTRKTNHKYTNKKQNNQNLGKQTQPTYVNNGGMSIGLKVWNKDGYGSWEYV